MSDSVPGPENQLVPASAADLMVIAHRPEEMRAAQEKTIAWAKAQLQEAQAEILAAELALESARSHKWRLEGFKRHVIEPKKKAEFYEKMVTALEQGYVIVPNFPVDIFAIRTKRDVPTGEATSMSWARYLQKSERPASGEGEYVDSQPKIEHETWKENNKEGKEVEKHSFYPTQFLPVDFPVKLVAPQILDATARAMALKVFDELGILPERRQLTRRSGVDPMVLGQLVYRRGNTERRVSFLVAWWLSARDLRV